MLPDVPANVSSFLGCDILQGLKRYQGQLCVKRCVYFDLPEREANSASQPLLPMSSQPTTGSTGSNQILKSFISGGIGGVCLCLAGHPFDLIKTRYQAAAPGQYPGGVLDVVKATFREGGVRGLYRGISAPLMGVTPIFAVCMWAYGVGKDVMRGVTGAESDSELSLLSLGCAGALSAIPTTAIMAPGERIKVMLVVPRAPGEAPFKGAGDVVRHLVKTEGVASLFRGATATLLRDGVGSFAYFAAYEAIKRSEKNGGAPASPLTIIMGGAAAGMANWIVALP